MDQEQPLDVLRRKLEELRKAEAIKADASQKFQLGEEIKEVESQIAELIRRETSGGARFLLGEPNLGVEDPVELLAVGGGR